MNGAPIDSVPAGAIPARQPQETGRSAPPWRVWLSLVLIFAVLLFYDSNRFQQLLLESEVRLSAQEAGAPAGKGAAVLVSAHRAIRRLAAVWGRIDAWKRTVWVGAVIDAEHGFTRAVGDALLLNLARPGGVSGAPGRETVETLAAANTEGPSNVYLIVGDSMVLSPLGAILGDELVREFGGRFVRRGVVGTGLSRPDYYDWAANLHKLVALNRPNVLVVLMGLNDVNAARGSGGRLEAFGTDAYLQQYAANLAEFLGVAQQSGIPVFWIEVPVTQDPRLNEKLERVNRMQQEAVQAFPKVHYLPTWRLLTDNEGRPRPYLKLEDGRSFRPWSGDGIHLSYDASRYVAGSMLPELRAALASPANVVPAGESVAGESSPREQPAAGASEPEVSIRHVRYLSRLLGREAELFSVSAPASDAGTAAALLLIYRGREPPETWMRQAVMPMARRQRIAVVLQEEPVVAAESGQARQWPETARMARQYLAEVHRAAESAEVHAPFGGLMVVAGSASPAAGLSLLAHSDLPCLSLLELDARRSHRAAPNAATTHGPAASAADSRAIPPGRIMSLPVPETGAPVAWDAALDRLVGAGFLALPYVPGVGAEEPVARHMAWHRLCHDLATPTWPGQGTVGREAVALATAYGLPDALASLISRGAPLDRRDLEGNTPLILAARAGRTGLAAMLIANGVALNARNDEGWSALALSALRGNAPLARQLIAAGAEVDLRDRERRTPLMAASWRGNLEVIGVLAGSKAQLEAGDRSGETALMKAAKFGRRDAAERLIELGAHVDTPDHAGHTALALAARYGKADLVAALIARGASVDGFDRAGWTPLMVAAQVGNLATARTLVGMGAKASALSYDGKSALMIASREGKTALVRYLIGVGSDPNLRDSLGRTALLYATRSGRARAVATLLKGGAEVDLADNRGNTPLLFAAYQQDADLVGLLLAAGADSARTNAKGDSPGSVAAADGPPTLQKLFETPRPSRPAR